MSVELRPEGIAVDVGDVTLSTPGLTGTAEYHLPATPGMRGAEQATDAFTTALDEAGMTEQLTVAITNHRELDARGGTRAGGGGDDIVVEIPGPGDGFGQVLLYAAEDGSLTWHLSDSFAPSQARKRGSERRTYRIPRAVVDQPTDGAPRQRGIIGAVGSKLLKVLVFPLIDPVLGKVGRRFAARWEEAHRRTALRWVTAANLTSGDAPSLTDAELTTLREGPTLLLIHGTFSATHSGFGAMSPVALDELVRRYEGRVVGFDHFTVASSLHDNAQRLATALSPLGAGGPLTVDVVTHSRGGLLGRQLAERTVDSGLTDLLSVRTLVMVAPPNAGTILADPDNLSQLVDRFTNLVQVLPGPGVTDVIATLLTVVKQLAVGVFKGLDGITSMNPNGAAMAAFNDSPGSAATYRVITANYEPPEGSALRQIAHDAGLDLVFGDTDNDLVVPTRGAFEVPGTKGFPVADALVIPADRGIDHSSFFRDQDVMDTLLAWLPGNSPG